MLADRGFTCNEKARMYLAEVKTPPFTKGKKQLEKQEIEGSRELSTVCIHVERVIGLLKQKYTILQGVLPINFISSINGDSDEAVVDKIVKCVVHVSICVHLLYHWNNNIIYFFFHLLNFGSKRHEGQYHLPLGGLRIPTHSKWKH